MALFSFIKVSSLQASLYLFQIICNLVVYFTEISKVTLINRELESLRQNILLLVVERFAAGEQFTYKGRGPRKQLLKSFDKTVFVLAAVLDPRIKMKPFLAKGKFLPVLVLSRNHS